MFGLAHKVSPVSPSLLPSLPETRLGCPPPVRFHLHHPSHLPTPRRVPTGDAWLDECVWCGVRLCRVLGGSAPPGPAAPRQLRRTQRSAAQRDRSNAARTASDDSVRMGEMYPSRETLCQKDSLEGQQFGPPRGAIAGWTKYPPVPFLAISVTSSFGCLVAHSSIPSRPKPRNPHLFSTL